MSLSPAGDQLWQRFDRHLQAAVEVSGIIFYFCDETVAIDIYQQRAIRRDFNWLCLQPKTPQAVKQLQADTYNWQQPIWLDLASALLSTAVNDDSDSETDNKPALLRNTLTLLNYLHSSRDRWLKPLQGPMVLVLPITIALPLDDIESWVNYVLLHLPDLWAKRMAVITDQQEPLIRQPGQSSLSASTATLSMPTDRTSQTPPSTSNSALDRWLALRETILAAEPDSINADDLTLALMALQQTTDPAANTALVADLQRVLDRYPETGTILKAQIEMATANAAAKHRDHQKAIDVLEASLDILPQLPEEKVGAWYGSLANAYAQNHKGNRSDNLENAIQYYNEALNIYTQLNYPEQWAGTKNNLALTYSDRISGNRSDNLENAIQYYNEALKVRTQLNYPEDWAMTNNNLANAYSNRISGNRSDNLENAIQYYNEALNIYTQLNYPEQWAMTNNNLANAYRDRISGNRSDNLENAIQYCNEALKVRTQLNYPEQWAATNNNLANTYSNRISGNRSDNLENAIQYYNEALNIYTQLNYPEQWAMTNNNLANAYRDRISGNRSDNLENAIQYCNEALKVRTQLNYPEQWAMTNNNLAAAYSDRISGNRSDNLENAIQCAQQSFEFIKKSPMLEPTKITRSFADIAFALKDQERVKSALDQTLNWIEDKSLTEYILAGEHQLRQELATILTLYLLLEDASRDTMATLKLLQRSRGRTLNRQQMIRALSDKKSIAQRAELQQLRQEWEITNKPAEGENQQPWHDRQHKMAARMQELTQALRSRLPPSPEPIFNLGECLLLPLWHTRKEGEQEIQQWCTWVAYHHPTKGLTATLIQHDKSILQSPLTDYLAYLDDNKNDQKAELANAALTAIVETAIPQWRADLQLILKDCEKVLLWPSGVMALLPWESGLTDYHPHRIVDLREDKASSAKTASFSRAIAQVSMPVITLLSPMLGIEKHLQTEADFNQWLDKTEYATLLCHGGHNVESPWDSSLLLENEAVQLKTIADQSFPSLQELVLIACDGGICNPNDEELVGLHHAFMAAGVRQVVAAICPVPQISAAFFMVYLLDLRASGTDLLTALQRSREWIRTVTLAELNDYYKNHPNVTAHTTASGSEKLAILNNALAVSQAESTTLENTPSNHPADNITTEQSNWQPFVHPKHWSAWVLYA